MASENLRQYIARMRRFVTVLWIVCLTFVVLERFSAVTIQLVAGGFRGDLWRAWTCQAAAAIPEGLFLVGLWWVREALAEFSRAKLFALPVTRMLDRVGVVLVCGSAVRIFVVPGACRLLGFGEPYWIAFDAAGLVLAAIGFALKAIAGVLRHASVIQSELDEIF